MFTEVAVAAVAVVAGCGGCSSVGFRWLHVDSAGLLLTVSFTVDPLINTILGETWRHLANTQTQKNETFQSKDAFFKNAEYHIGKLFLVKTFSSSTHLFVFSSKL